MDVGFEELSTARQTDIYAQKPLRATKVFLLATSVAGFNVFGTGDLYPLAKHVSLVTTHIHTPIAVLPFLLPTNPKP